jgi:hypothetical protein
MSRSEGGRSFSYLVHRIGIKEWKAHEKKISIHCEAFPIILFEKHNI